MTNPLQLKRPFWLGAIALFAVLFGLLTLRSGGAVLFEAEARQAAGNYVPFVVWFNFLAGFAYVAAGVGLWLQQRWAVWLSGLIAGATLVTFAAFGVYLLSGGGYEVRTVAAMSLRAVVWIVISVAAYQYARRYS
ncbi:MAG: hypothetical protein BroJett011_06660 [Chloroflexota bacterium]|nr:MAG: hypothetical protein BroJett011_06660 [Chloroflexota bacterium]